METLRRREPAGSSKGGRFAPGKVADTTESKPMKLGTTSYSQSSVQKFAWGNDKPTNVSELEEYVSKEGHQDLALDQAAIADTSAEIWYSMTPHSHREGVLSTLRTVESLAPLTSSSMLLAKSLQDSILDSEQPDRYIVYRGIRGPADSHAGHIASTVEVGDTIESEGFWSTSTSPSVCEGFAGTFFDTNVSVMFRIDTNVGKFLPSSSNEKALRNGFYNEYEVVLPHKAKFEVVDKTVLKSNHPDRQPFIMISLQYVGTDEGDDFDLLRTRYKQEEVDSNDYLIPEDELDSELVSKVTMLTRSYRETGLPMGDRTTRLSE